MSFDPQAPRPPGAAPLARPAVAAMAGVVLDRFASPCSTFAWATIALAAVALAAPLRRRPKGRAWLILAATAALAGGWHHHSWSDLPADDLGRVAWGPGERRPAWVRGVIVQGPTFRKPAADTPADKGTTRTTLALTAINQGRGWEPASGRALTYIGGERLDLEPGVPVEAAGSLSGVEGPSNPGEFDPRPYQRAQGIRLRLSVDGPSGIWGDPDGRPWPLYRWQGATRAWALRTLERRTGLDPRVAPLASALLLGRRDEVDPEVNDAFARTGTTHLLAISGLHLVVLAAVLGSAVRLLGVGRKGSFLVVAAGTAAYALLVGLAPSVVRSAAMTLTFCFAGWRDRQASAANTLALAALITLAYNPPDLFDVGSQLSFLGVASVVWLVPGVLDWDAPELTPLDVLERRLEPWYRTLRRMGLTYVRAGVIGSTVIWLVGWPLVALRFHLVSPVAILANLPLIPLTSLALMLAGLALGLSAIWPPLGGPFAWLCGHCLGATEAIVRLAKGWRWGHAFVPGPSWAWTLAFYALLAVATVAGVGRWRSRHAWWGGTIAWALLGATLAMVPSRPKALQADVLAVGHGLAVVVRSPEGRTILYDCGRQGDPHVGRRVIAPALWSMGVRRLDMIILTHADADHFNGLPDLLDRFEVGLVRTPSRFATDANPAARALIDDVRRRGIPVEPIARGDRVDLGGGSTLLAWHPQADARPGATDNALSVVLELSSSGRRLLLTGDLEREGLTDLIHLPRPETGFDAMLSPHHGGRTSNPPWLYAWARPRLVVVSQRPPPNPSRDPLTPLAVGHFPLLRTWQSGAIRLAWEPAGLVATGFLDPPAKASTPAVASLAPPWSNAAWIALGLLAGAALCLALTVAEWGAWSLVLPGRRLEESSDEHDRGIDIEATTPDGTRLAGAWFPCLDARGRTLILLHGLAEDRRALLGRVPFLLRSGWNVAVLDARASGESGGRPGSSGGRDADDLIRWIDILAKMTGESALFAIWGRSMGAATALKAAVADPRTASLILEAPFHDLKPAVAAVLRRLRIPGVLATLILLRARLMTGAALDRPRPIDLAPRVTVPTLILHGELDPIAPLADARRLALAFPHPAEVVAVAGAGHANVVGIGGDELMAKIIAFLDRHASPLAADRHGQP